MIPFDDMDDRLTAIGKNRQWLAEQSGKAPDTIRTALAKGAPPAKRSPKLQKLLSDCIEREEANQVLSSLPERIILEVDTATFDLFSEAARAANMTLKAWMLHELNRAAKLARNFQFVAEDPAEYDAKSSPSSNAGGA